MSVAMLMRLTGGMNTMVFRRMLLAVAVVGCLVAGGCNKGERCKVSIGDARFHIEPDNAAYGNLNNVGGYEYFEGGHRGVIVVRMGLYDFVAYERTCPEDNTTKVVVSEDWGSTVLECPVCGSRYNAYGNGEPLTGSATRCCLYQYYCHYDGRTLYVSN